MTGTPDWQLLKLGGELLEDEARMRAIAGTIARVAAAGPLAVVHGGGREIDAALTRAGIAKHQVEGVRVTDAATLSIVVEVLAGAINTRFVAAITAAGGAAVGLTGADAALGLVERAAPLQTVAGALVDLGFVGQPVATGRPRLLADLGGLGYIPVVASLGVTADGVLHNVNADTLAAHLAARLSVSRLVIAGATPGVLDGGGHTIPRLTRGDVARLIGSGVASAGMVAKLRACDEALANGAREVLLVDGRDAVVLERILTGATDPSTAPMTVMVAA